LSFNLRAARIIRQNGAPGDILHLHSMNETSFLLTRAGIQVGLHPVLLMTLLDSDDPGSFSGPLRQFKLRSFHDAEALISISSALTDSCLVAGIEQDQIHQIPCGVDTARFTPIPSSQKQSLIKRLGLDLTRRHIIFVGSALHRKGIDILIASFIELANQLQGVDLLIVGPHDFSDHTRHDSGRQNLIAELKADLAEAGINDRVHWIGQVDNVHEYMAASDVFCFPTRREGFGIVIAEALSSGLPCVVARIEGVTTDLLPSDQVGLLIQGYNPSDYAQALLRLLQDPSLFVTLSQHARRFALSNFDMENIADQFAALYTKLAENHRA